MALYFGAIILDLFHAFLMHFPAFDPSCTARSHCDEMSSPLMHQGFGSNDLDDIISPLESWASMV
jgi:hypothetical protein